jgi:hypothetical protein
MILCVSFSGIMDKNSEKVIEKWFIVILIVSCSYNSGSGGAVADSTVGDFYTSHFDVSYFASSLEDVLESDRLLEAPVDSREME